MRENVEGLYVGVEHFVRVGDDPRAVAESMAIVTRVGCERIVRYAFEYAVRNGRKKVTIVHKANILKMVSGLFLEVGRAVAAEYEGRVAFNDLIIDNAAMQMVLRPEQFDVMVTTNMFGDILSDLAAGLVGGLGLAPGGNIGTHAAIFEAVHGSAPDIAGKGVANPAALILAGAMMLDHVGEVGAGNASAPRWRGSSSRTRCGPATSAGPPRPWSSAMQLSGGSPDVPCLTCGRRIFGLQLGHRLPRVPRQARGTGRPARAGAWRWAPPSSWRSMSGSGSRPNRRWAGSTASSPCSPRMSSCGGS